MTDTQTTQPVAPVATKKTMTVEDDMTARRIFTSTADAATYLNLCHETYSDFATIPLAAVGLDSEGDFDPAVYVPGMNVMVAILRKAKQGVKAIVIAPVPSLTMLTADSTGTDWVTKIIEKELNHVAVRALREAEDISTVVDQMPSTRDAYISSAREGGMGILEAFNELYKPINATMSGKVSVWAKARLIKSDLKKCMESKGYAEEFYPALENRGEGKDSLFVVALNLGVAAAKAKGFDPTIFARWIATRANKAFTPGADDDTDSFDMDSMTADLMKEDAPAAAAVPAAN